MSDGLSVTGLLHEMRLGNEAAKNRAGVIVYDELRRLAHRALRGERREHTLQTTALVNEAFMRLVDADLPWEDRRHFYAVAAKAMRRILVDHARAKRRDKRGGRMKPVPFDDERWSAPGRPPDILALDEALSGLGVRDARKARAVELHYFGGLTYDEIAEVLEVSAATVHRELRLAKAWLSRELSRETE